eukprot:2390735-Prymnesium_polylepis.1
MAPRDGVPLLRVKGSLQQSDHRARKRSDPCARRRVTLGPDSSLCRKRKAVRASRVTRRATPARPPFNPSRPPCVGAGSRKERQPGPATDSAGRVAGSPRTWRVRP